MTNSIRQHCTLLYEDDDLKITSEPYFQSGTAIVSFAGISFGLINTGEFRKTLSGFEYDVYHVFDKKRRWFNGTHQQRIVDVLNEAILGRGSKTVFTIGNSMGGTGAVLFAADITNCKRAISFCPQSSLGKPRLRSVRRSLARIPR